MNLRRRHLLAVAATLLLAMPAHAERISAVAATVNDEVITTYEMEKEAAAMIRELERRGGEQLDQAKVRLQVTALNRLVEKHLIAQKIRELNIKVTEEEVRATIEDVKKQNKLSQEALVNALRSQGLSFDEYKDQLKEQMERLRLVSAEVKAKIQIGEKEMRDYYQANPQRFLEDEQYRARHIFLKLPKDADSATVKQVMLTAASVYSEARSGADFAELARKYSNDPSAKNGGDLGTFRKGEVLSEFSAALEKLQPGQVSELLSTPGGFHILKLEERIAGRQKPFEQVRSEIEEQIYKQKSEERFSKWLEELRKNAAIDIRMEG